MYGILKYIILGFRVKMDLRRFYIVMEFWVVWEDVMLKCIFVFFMKREFEEMNRIIFWIK